MNERPRPDEEGVYEKMGASISPQAFSLEMVISMSLAALATLAMRLRIATNIPTICCCFSAKNERISC